MWAELTELEKDFFFSSVAELCFCLFFVCVCVGGVGVLPAVPGRTLKVSCHKRTAAYDAVMLQLLGR